MPSNITPKIDIQWEMLEDFENLIDEATIRQMFRGVQPIKKTKSLAHNPFKITTTGTATTGTATTGSLTNTVYTNNITNIGSLQNKIYNSWLNVSPPRKSGPNKIHPGEYLLADGAKLIVSENMSYRIEDENAQVIYQANRVREFNKYLNASDLLEEFILYLGKMGVRRAEIEEIPVSMFIMWLIVRAAEQDGDTLPAEEADSMKRQISFSKHPRCRCCGRFITRLRSQAGVFFCNGDHADRYMQRYQPSTAPALA